MTVQADLRRTCSETQIVGFLMLRLNFCFCFADVSVKPAGFFECHLKYAGERQKKQQHIHGNVIFAFALSFCVKEKLTPGVRN